MHPQTMYKHATLKIADEVARAERERRNRIARGEPSPDAIAFEAPVEHLSFTSRLRLLVGSVRPTGLTARPSTG
jgi:hypothetical protein